MVGSWSPATERWLGLCWMKKKDSDFENECEEKEKLYGDDFISSLPDDLLVPILSRLTLKEAGTTSVLSRRWRYLWTNVARLHFDADDKLASIAYRTKYIDWVKRVVRRHRRRMLDVLRIWYVDWVNGVLRQHSGPALEFKICFNLDKRWSDAIDNWVDIAIAKRVQSLELDLLGDEEPMDNNYYSFPCKPGTLNCLRVVSLTGVNVSEEALDCFLLRCPELEKLSLCEASGLRNVKISGFELSIKCLEIFCCPEIDTIEIANSSIESFTYEGFDDIDLIISNVPMLDQVMIMEGDSALENNVFGQLSCCLNQLKILELTIFFNSENAEIFSFPVLPNLKMLTLNVGAWDDDSLLEFAYFVKSCPNLNIVEFRLIRMSLILRSNQPDRRREMMRVPKCAHEHLKVVYICGYYGRKSDVELAIYFVEKDVAALQMIKIDPCSRIRDISSQVVAEIKRQETARRHARDQLESKIPPQIKLVIL